MTFKHFAFNRYTDPPPYFAEMKHSLMQSIYEFGKTPREALQNLDATLATIAAEVVAAREEIAEALKELPE